MAILDRVTNRSSYFSYSGLRLGLSLIKFLVSRVVSELLLLWLCSSAAGIHTQLQLHSIHSTYYRVCTSRTNFQSTKKKEIWSSHANIIHNPCPRIRRSVNPVRAWGFWFHISALARLLWSPLICRYPPPTTQSPHPQNISQNSCLRFPKMECIGNWCWWSIKGGGEWKCGGWWCWRDVGNGWRRQLPMGVILISGWGKELCLWVWTFGIGECYCTEILYHFRGRFRIFG